MSTKINAIRIGLLTNYTSDYVTVLRSVKVTSLPVFNLHEERGIQVVAFPEEKEAA